MPSSTCYVPGTVHLHGSPRPRCQKFPPPLMPTSLEASIADEIGLRTSDFTQFTPNGTHVTNSATLLLRKLHWFLLRGSKLKCRSPIWSSRLPGPAVSPAVASTHPPPEDVSHVPATAHTIITATAPPPHAASSETQGAC